MQHGSFPFLLYLAKAVSVYSWIIFARILVSWFPFVAMSSPGRLLAMVTDPFLNLFRRGRFARVGALDFSPLVAMLSLNLLATILRQVAVSGRVSVALIITYILFAVWGVCSFFLSAFSIVAVVRFISLFFRAYGPFFLVLDRVLSSPVNKISDILARRRVISYHVLVGVVALSVLILRFGGAVLVQIAARLIRLIPF